MNQNLNRNLCRIFGHDCEIGATNFPSEMMYQIVGYCRRCEKRHMKRITYSSIGTQRFDPIRRAYEAIKEEFKNV